MSCSYMVLYSVIMYAVYFFLAASRINEKRLKWKSNCIAPPSFHLPAPTFQMVTREMLQLDCDAVVNILC